MLIRPEIATLTQYKPGIRPTPEMHELGATEDPARLNGNELPWPPFPEAIEAMTRGLAGLNRYPDQTYKDLREALSKLHGVPAGQILVSNGAVPLIRLIAEVVLRPDDEVFITWPPYPNYMVVTGLSNGVLRKVPAKDGAMDVRTVVDRISDRSRVVFMANPHNPTASIVPTEDLQWYFGQVPDHVLTVMDEAYIEFVTDPPNYPDMRAFLDLGKPVIGLRTFSKVYGLAGLRVGYAFGTQEIVDAINKAREVHILSSIAAEAAIASLTRQDLVRERVQKIVLERERLKKIVDGLGLTYTPSQANFLWIDVRRDSQAVFLELMRRGVLVRAGDTHSSPGWIRVTVGLPHENDRFAKAMDEVLEEVPQATPAGAALSTP